MSTYTILTTGAMTESGLQTTLRNNNGRAKAFPALVKDAVTEKKSKSTLVKKIIRLLPPIRFFANSLQARNQ